MKLYKEKPKTVKGQVDCLWDTVHNHLVTKVSMLDIQLKFILAFLGLLLALMAIVLSKLL